GLIEMLGEKRRLIIERFTEFLHEAFPHKYILMRTGEFGTMEDPQGTMQILLARCEALGTPDQRTAHDKSFWADQRWQLRQTKTPTRHLIGEGLPGGEVVAPPTYSNRAIERIEWIIALGFFAGVALFTGLYFKSIIAGLISGAVIGLSYLVRVWVRWRSHSRT